MSAAALLRGYIELTNFFESWSGKDRCRKDLSWCFGVLLYFLCGTTSLLNTGQKWPNAGLVSDPDQLT